MATIDEYVEQTYPVECKGRAAGSTKPLSEAVTAEIKIYKSPGSSMISSEIKCPYNTGSHRGKCNASGEEVTCPYSFDIPYAMENR